jgi:adenosylcobinamide kinase/adenosylcobinamide-phosphate guanylyltransferase
MALLDLLASPTQLGCLRARGLVYQRTVVAAAYTDHRISSAEEMARRCGLWGVRQASDGQLITGPAANPAPQAVRPHRTLIIGGARSGKSTEAELRLAAESQVTYVAAGPFAADSHSWIGPDGGPDTEWAHRVAVHRARRPGWWRTVESLDVAEILRAETGALLIDGIGTWLAAVLDEAGMWAVEAAGSGTEVADSESGQGRPITVRPDPAAVVQARIDELADAWRQTSALVVAVTDQVGSGLVPAYPAGRLFRDQLGWLNQRLAAESELTLQVIAGRATALPG